MLLLFFWRSYRFLGYNTRNLTEENESEFSSLWSNRIRLHRCAEIFVNQNFPGDYFFNKIKIMSPCPDISLVISEAKRIFFSSKSGCFFHVLDDPLYRETNSILEQQQFCHIDSMLTFSANIEELPPKHNKRDYDSNVSQFFVTDPSLACIWTDLFCKSFNIENCMQVHDLIMSRYLDFELIVAKVKTNSVLVPAACALLYYYKKAMGLYCLGTLPEFRRKGLATQIVKSSIMRAKNKRVKLFFVQTFLNDGYANMYKKAGLHLEYRKRIYANPSNGTFPQFSSQT
jgi:GNAT superfamily N-acetyltransferase